MLILPKAREYVEQQTHSFIADWNANLLSNHFRRQYLLSFLTRLSILLPFDPALVLLGV